MVKKKLPYMLGRNVEHDPRSRDHPFPVEKLAPVSVQWSITASVLNQGHLGSCTGNAMAQLLNTDMFTPVRKKTHNGATFKETDAVALYSKATHLDNASGSYPPDDTGSSGIAVAKAAKFFGYVDTYTHCFTWAQFCAAIQTQPVIVGTPWTQQMFTPKGGLVTVGPINDDTVAGGHEYLCRGIDYPSQLLTFRNSWGSSWGLGGEFHMSFTDFETLLANTGDVTVPHGIGLP